MLTVYAVALTHRPPLQSDVDLPSLILSIPNEELTSNLV